MNSFRAIKTCFCHKIGAVLASIKILAIEDYADTRKLLKIFLEWRGLKSRGTRRDIVHSTPRPRIS
jgi:hypothetical protein